MSSIVSRRPSSRNHLNEAFWMSIRLGRSRTCFRREYDLRALGAATLVAKKRASLGKTRAVRNRRVETANVRDVGATHQGTRSSRLFASAAQGGVPSGPQPLEPGPTA